MRRLLIVVKKNLNILSKTEIGLNHFCLYKIIKLSQFRIYQDSGKCLLVVTKQQQQQFD